MHMRSDMKKYHILPAPGKWIITSEKAGEQLFEYETKEEAVKACGSILPGEVVSVKIHRKDGTIEEERTYPRSADPVESRG